MKKFNSYIWEILRRNYSLEHWYEAFPNLIIHLYLYAHWERWSDTFIHNRLVWERQSIQIVWYNDQQHYIKSEYWHMNLKLSANLLVKIDLWSILCYWNTLNNCGAEAETLVTWNWSRNYSSLCLTQQWSFQTRSIILF